MSSPIRSLPSAAHVLVGLGIGITSWTATEYATHRWLLHGPFGRGHLERIPIGSLHRAHHRAPLATSLLGRSSAHAVVAGLSAAASFGLGLAMPTLAARVAAATFACGYSTYDIVHWNLHHRSARTAWGERARERHMRHHFGSPKANLGVTMAFWDRLLGTEADVHRGANHANHQERAATTAAA